MAIIQGFAYDDETGEVAFYDINEETGEPLLEKNIRTACTVPRKNSPTAVKKYTKFPKGHVTKTKKFQSLKAQIIAGDHPVSHRMLLILPTVIMIFPGLICAMLMLLEVFLHVTCHKKNKNLKNPNSVYRSPFHVVTSIFCGVCRDCDTASKIGHIQDKRKDRYDYLRQIAI